jgi:hypothetical protein
MRGQAMKRLHLLRLAAYLVIVAVCGAVAGYEVYYALAGETTTGTIVSVGKGGGMSRSAQYFADYEYFDTQHVRHVAHARWVHPTTAVGDSVEVQYLRHSPETSRLAPSPAAGLCYGAVAILAAVVFVGEILIRRRSRRRHHGTVVTE